MKSTRYLTGAAVLATIGVLAAIAQPFDGEPDSGAAGSIITPVTQEAGAILTTLAATATPMATAASLTLVRHDIGVTTVDSTATQPNNSQTGVPNKHLVLAPANASDRKGRLFLYLLGTNSSEVKQQAIGYAAANRGYNAITLAFPNADAIAVLCLGVADTGCTGKVREEMLTGVNVSNRIAVSPQNAIETRLKNLLIYLRTTYPAEGWDSFLIGNNIDWSKVSATGHSQGAGHVAYLAKRHAMYRAAMISGVADKTLGGQTAPWLSLANQTPAASQYGFTHTSDTVVTTATAEASWNAIGLNQYGVKQSVDSQGPNYAGSHKLTTSRSPGSGVNAHLAMADDDKLPRDANNVPYWEEVWAFMAMP